MPGLTSTNVGITPLKRLQWGAEATPGTSVVATSMLRGDHNMQDDTKVTVPNENIGIFWDTDRNYIPSTGATLTIPAIPATFEQLPYFGELGVKLQTTGVADGAGSGYIYTYPFPTTWATGRNTIRTASLETGDDFQTWFSNYAFLRTWKISGKYDEAIMMEGTMQSRAVAPNTYTAITISCDSSHHFLDSANGLAVFPLGSKFISNVTGNVGTFTVTTSTAAQLTVTETTTTQAAGSSFTLSQTFTGVTVTAVNTMVFNQLKLYIDSVGGSFGTTQKTGTFLSFEHTLSDSGWLGQPAGDGRKDFSFARFTKPQATMKITMVHEATAVAEYANFQAGTPRLIRIINQGPKLTTAGTTYSYYTMILDMVGVWTKFNPPTSDKNLNTIVAEMQLAYDTTQASAGQLLIVNQVSALP